MPIQPPKSPPPNQNQFQGFDMPRQNWFKMPGEWTNITSEISSLSELKVVEYVLKHTWGYQEYGLKKRISIDEFMSGRRRVDGSRIDKGTGLSKPSVVSGIKSAVKRGLLIEELNDSDKGRIKKFYTLRMRQDDDSEDQDEEGNPAQIEASSEENGTRERSFTPGVKDLNRGVKDLYPRGKESIHRTEKETLERNQQERIATRAERSDNNNTSGTQTQPQADVVVVALTGWGITQRIAQRLAERYKSERIYKQMDFIEFRASQEELKNPAGLLRKAIEEDWASPAGYQSPEQRQAAQEAAERVAEEELKAQEVAEEERRQQQATERAQKEAFDRQLVQEWGTTDEDTKLWEEEIQPRINSTVSDILATDMRLLTLADETAIVGVSSTFMAQRLQHPGTIKAIEKAIKSVTKHQVSLQIVVVGTPDNPATEGER